MAIESVEANAGSGGATFATDQITGGVNVPYVKLMSGADAAEDLIGGDATNGLDVDVTRVSGTVTVDGSGVTQPISAASLPLPTGASTAANQTTIIGHLDGVEGLLTTIDGDTGNIVTAVQLIDNAIHVDDAAFTLGTSSGVMIMGFAGTQSVNANDAAALACETDGSLHIHDGGNSITVDNGGTFAVQVSSIAAGDNNIGNVDVASSALPTGASTSANQTTIIGHLDGVEGLLTTIDGDTGNIVTAVQLLDNTIVADDAGFTPGTTSVNMAGFQADETATDSVDEGDAGAARMTLDRKQIVTPQPHTAGGCTPFYNLDVDETEDAIKASAGQLYELYLFNTTNAIVYVKLYNATTANVTVGTTTPLMTIPVPGNNDTDGAGVVRNWPLGIEFGTAITIAATTGAADNDTGAPGAGAIIASGAYK